MSHRCHDEWFWAFLFVIASQNDSRQTYCPPEPDTRPWRDEYASDAPRPAEKPHTIWTSRWAWAIGGAAACALGFALVLNANTVHYAARVPSDVVALPSPVVVSAVSEPLPSIETLHVEETPKPLPNAVPVAAPEEVPLPSQIVGMETSLSDIVAPGDTLLSTRFSVGSTREQVLTAQGVAPTYATRDSWWWGSSKVTFSREGRVTAWTEGTPPLMARR